MASNDEARAAQANIEQLQAALIKADAAGDTAGAKALADHLRQVKQTTAWITPIGHQVEKPSSLLDQAWDGTKNLGLGLAKGALAPIDGGAQLLSQGIASATHAVAPGSAADKWARDQANGVSDINTDRENKYQAMTPGSIAAGVGNVLGQTLIPLKGTQVASRGASLGAKLAGGVTTGAVVGASQPVYGAGDRNLTSLIADSHPVDYWSEKAKQIGLGAALGGGLSGVASAGGAVINALRPVLSPKSTVGDQLLKGLDKVSTSGPLAPEASGNLPSLTGSSAPADVLARLQAARPLVPGSIPTTAQVAGVPELVMAEKTLKNNPAFRGAFEDRSIANNQARLTEIQRIARTPEDLLRAEAARTADTAPLYAAARESTLPLDGDLQSLLSRPSMQQAIARAGKLAAERGEPPLALPTPGQPVPATVDGGMLQYIKMGLDDLQKVSDAKGIGAHESGALHDTQGALGGWMNTYWPAYAAADQAFASASRPINSMKAGQGIYNSLTDGTLNAAGDVAPVLSQFRTQYAKALKNSPYGLPPETQSALDAIQSDLQRETISNSIRSAGSDTMFNAQAPNWLSGKLFGENLDGKSMVGQALGGLLAGHGTLGMATLGGAVGAQKVGQFVGNRVNSEFQQAMLNPDHFAKLLGDALERQAGDASTFQKLAPAWTRGATVGAENVISPGP